MKAFHTFDTSLRLNLLILFTAGLLFWSSTATFLPTLPLYIEDVGGSKQEIGVVMGGFAIGLLLFRPMLGRLADQHGRKLLLLIGTFVATTAPFGYLAFKAIPILMLVRIFHGISIAAFTTGYSALVADLAPMAIRGEIISYMSLTAPIGLAIGPALGGYLQAATGYPLLFLLTAELAFIGFLGALQVNNPPAQKQQAIQNNSNFWQTLSSPRVRIPSLVMLLVGIGVGAVHTFVPLFIKSTGAELNAGLFFTITAISSFMIRIVAGKASDCLGRGLFITFGIVAYIIASLLLFFASSRITFILAALAEGCGGGTMISMITTLMADRSLPQERGQVFAICIAGFDLGIAIAAPILGFLAQQMGYRSIFFYTSALMFLALLIFITLSNKNLNHSLKFALGRGQDVYSLNSSN